MAKDGTYQIAITCTSPIAGEGAIMTSRMWPGTSSGSTPPQTLREAVNIALGLAESMEKEGLPNFGPICELRITTFEQLGEDDPLIEVT